MYFLFTTLCAPAKSPPSSPGERGVKSAFVNQISAILFARSSWLKCFKRFSDCRLPTSSFGLQTQENRKFNFELIQVLLSRSWSLPKTRFVKLKIDFFKNFLNFYLSKRFLKFGSFCKCLFQSFSQRLRENRCNFCTVLINQRSLKKNWQSYFLESKVLDRLSKVKRSFDLAYQFLFERR